MKLEFETNIFKEGGVYQVDCIAKRTKGKSLTILLFQTNFYAIAMSFTDICNKLSKNKELNNVEEIHEYLFPYMRLMIELTNELGKQGIPGLYFRTTDESIPTINTKGLYDTNIGFVKLMSVIYDKLIHDCFKLVYVDKVKASYKEITTIIVEALLPLKDSLILYYNNKINDDEMHDLVKNLFN